MKKLPKTLSVFHSALKMYHVYVFEAKLTKDLLWVFFHEEFTSHLSYLLLRWRRRKSVTLEPYKIKLIP